MNNQNEPFIERVVANLMDQGVATHFVGCTDQEIIKCEQEWRTKLPSAYRMFLSRMGKSAGRFYLGSDLFFPEILPLKEAAVELVSEDEAGLLLPSDAIVFSMHQGYQFLFMRASEGDNPPVYYYMEQSGEFVKEFDRFSVHLLCASLDKW